MTSIANIPQTWINSFDGPLIIGGPCSAESEDQVLKIAEQLDKSYVHIYRAGIWKPRTKPGNFEGVGEIGLKWLKRVKEEYGMLTATEVANPRHIKLALKYDVDILWIGARTTVSPFIVQEIAECLNGTDKIVMVKNPVNPDLELWIGAMERLASQNIKKLGAIHRGFSTYKKTKYRNNPQWQIALEFKARLPHIPLLADPSHICGNREGIFDVCQNAFNFKYDGLMVETHIDPDNAWSDAKQQITPDRLLEILKSLKLRTSSEETDQDYYDEITRLRSQIDDVDSQLLNCLLERMKISEQIGSIKNEHNLAVFHAERWEKISKSLKDQGAKLGLSDDLITNIYNALHSESVRIQNKVMSK